MNIWKPVSPHNWRLECDGFAVSYLEGLHSTLHPWPETAIWQDVEGSTMFILGGDHRKDYEAILDAEEGWSGCLAYYHSVKHRERAANERLASARAALDPSERMLMIDEFHAVCVGGRWDGWKMWRHPDGGWVSIEKLTEVAL